MHNTKKIVAYIQQQVCTNKAARQLFCSSLWFCFQELNCFFEISVRNTRKILRVSQNSKLHPRNLVLEPRKSKLETRASILENFEDRESSFESRLSTYIWAVLYLQDAFTQQGHATIIFLQRMHMHMYIAGSYFVLLCRFGFCACPLCHRMCKVTKVTSEANKIMRNAIDLMSITFRWTSSSSRQCIFSMTLDGSRWLPS